MTHMTTDPEGRDRSISFGANNIQSPMNPTVNNRGPFNTTGSPNRPVTMPSHDTVPDMPRFHAVHQGLQRPTSLYSTGHLYEEIKDKSQAPSGANVSFNAQGILVDAKVVPIPGQTVAGTPVYANEMEDLNGYLMPNKSNKVVNTPTEEGSKYLVMQGVPSSSPFMNASRLSDSANINKNFSKPHPQMKDIHGAGNFSEAVFHARKHSHDSTLSNEENTTPEKQLYHAKPVLVGDPADVNGGFTNTTRHLSSDMLHRPMPQSMHSTPNFQRQRMPLPETPKPNTSNNETITFPLNKQPLDKKLHMVSFQHQRANSLPDTSVSSTQPCHARSPSTELPQESYDVPRSLGNLPTSLTDSAGSIDDINGTIV